MEDLKLIIADNISRYRKKMGITQLELAEKLNYSDKAVSKWERGESIPDLIVLKKLSELFGVSLDHLCTKIPDNKVKIINKFVVNRTLVMLGIVFLVYLVATIVFVCLNLNNIPNAYMCYIIAIPTFSIILTIICMCWKKWLYSFIYSSIFIWTSILVVCLFCTANNIWLLFIIGIPVQILFVIGYLYGKFKRKSIKK